jgi:hypothetical protein
VFKRGDFVPEPLPLQNGLDFSYYSLHRLGLVDKAIGAEPNCLYAPVVIPGAGIHDDGDFTSLLL